MQMVSRRHISIQWPAHPNSLCLLGYCAMKRHQHDPVMATILWFVFCTISFNSISCKQLIWFQFVGKRGPNSQSAMHDFDKTTGVMVYSQVGINGVACWNSAKRYTPENHAIIARNDQKMIYPGDLNVWNCSLQLIFTRREWIMLHFIWKLFTGGFGRGNLDDDKYYAAIYLRSLGPEWIQFPYLASADSRCNRWNCLWGWEILIEKNEFF